MNLKESWNISDHELIEQIGSGSYGDVWRARSVAGTDRAVKIAASGTVTASSERTRKKRFSVADVTTFERVIWLMVSSTLKRLTYDSV